MVNAIIILIFLSIVFVSLRRRNTNKKKHGNTKKSLEYMSKNKDINKQNGNIPSNSTVAVKISNDVTQANAGEDSTNPYADVEDDHCTAYDGSDNTEYNVSSGGYEDYSNAAENEKLSKLQQGVIFAEILSKPVSMRK